VLLMHDAAKLIILIVADGFWLAAAGLVFRAGGDAAGIIIGEGWGTISGWVWGCVRR
jgi:hypothetical protein